MPDTPPLIVTLQLNQEASEFFNALRKKHFPPKINYLDAHLTLFHQLPNTTAIPDLLASVAAEQARMPLEVTEVMKLGRGIGFKVQSEDLKQLHSRLQQHWQDWLTPQDRQKLRPHVTVQNKVEAATANALFEQLNADFTPFAATGIGLQLWEYLGGPWRKVQDFDFAL